MEEAVSEKRKAIAAAHGSDEDEQAHMSASRKDSSVTAQAKEGHNRGHAHFSLLNLSPNQCIIFLFCSLAGSCFSSPNFTNCSFPRELASILADYLRSHFSVSHQ